MNGFFPRFMRLKDGTLVIVSGAGELWLTDVRTRRSISLSIAGHEPVPVDDEHLLYHTDRPVPGTFLFDFITSRKVFDQELIELAGGAGKWAGMQPGVGTRWSNGRLMPHTGEPFIAADGQDVWRTDDVRREPTCGQGIEAWTVDGGCVTKRLSDGRETRYPGQFRPRVVITPQGPWVLSMTTTTLCLQPEGERDGYERVYGNDRNLYSDAIFDAGAIEVTATDKAGGGGLAAPWRQSLSDFPRTRVGAAQPPSEEEEPVLRKPEVTVDNWTLDELLDGKEIAFHDRENPALDYGGRVFVRDGSLHVEMRNATGVGFTLERRPVKRPSEPSPPPPPPPDDPAATPEAVCRLIWRTELEREIDPDGLTDCVRQLRDGRSADAIRAGVRDSDEYRELQEQKRNRPRADMHQWPKFGASYQTAMTNPDVVLAEWAAMLADAGCDLTRQWLLDAWAVGPHGPGQYAGYVPWLRDANGVFDLDAPNERYFARLRAYVEIMNAVGITVQLTVLELYGWSKRKAGMLWVPDQNLGPFRRNKNGVRWGDPDDPTFSALPDAVLAQFIARVCETVRGLAVAFEVGNEMPEKPMHERIAAALRSHFTSDWRPDITVNRQEDTPGQYDNMRIGRDYDRIAFHGKASLAYLDEDYPREPKYRTFRDFFARGNYDPARIIMSTDGCRVKGPVLRPYDLDQLGEVCRDHLRRGFGFEHQSQVKMRPFLEGRLDLRADFEAEWLRSVRA